MNTQTKFLNLIIGLLVLLLCQTTSQAKITEENQRKIDQLNEMTVLLHKQGLEGFLRISRERQWVAPKMYSAWFIGKLPDDPDGKKLVELAKSAFGHEMARQLTPVAKVVRDTKVAATLEVQFELLFTAIGWLGTETGYANMLLQQRADDIASIAATKLMADINFPLEQAAKAMNRFDDRRWASPERSRQVLFEESGGTHFVTQGAPATEEMLDREFREGVDLVLKLGNVVGRPDLEIFTEERFSQTESVMDLEKTLTKRAHINFAERGFGSVNLRNLVTLHEFRSRYGKLPLQPETYQPKPGESKIAAAFKELSWENPYGIGGAEDTFEAYLENRLADEVFRATDRSLNPNAK